jgi:hypothetical protein
MTNSDAYSNTNVVVTVPAFGDIRIDQGTSGTGIDRIDDVTPNVWEEAYAVGIGTGIDTINGSAGGSTIEYTPNMLPDGLTARIAYSPDVGGKNAADKSNTATNTPEDAGYDLTLQATSDVTGIDGLTVWAGMSRITQDSTVSGYSGDQEEDTFAFSYAMGGFTVGYQWSEEDLGTSTGTKQYENEGYGITFQVNDDLSVGYNHYESVQVASTNTTADASSIQIAYSMGGASIRLAEGTANNTAYQTTAAYDKDATLLSVSLAF